MPPHKTAESEEAKRQFISLGRGNSAKGQGIGSPRYRCKHCQWEGAATSPSRLKEHLTSCKPYKQAVQPSPTANQKAPVVPLFKPMKQQTLKQTGIDVLTTDEREVFDLAASTAIITDGRPFCLFESTAFRAFFAKLRPGWEPVTYHKVVARLPRVHEQLLEQVIKLFRGADHLNIIFDASENVSAQRIVNVCVKLPDNGPAFYWKTFDTAEKQHTAENWVNLLMPELVCYVRPLFLGCEVTANINLHSLPSVKAT